MVGQTVAIAIDEAVELVPNKLYRLGGVCPIDDDISWIPKGVEGYEPLSAFLLLEEDGALLVDTGVPLNKDAVAAQLDSIIGREREIQVFLTRFEPDCLANMPMLTDLFNIKKVAGGGVSNPFDFFDDLSTQEQLRADYNVTMTRLLPTDIIHVSPTRELSLVVTSIRLLNTFWGYDAATKTLFTSDSFGHVPVSDPSQVPVVTSENDTATFEQVRDHHLTKFDWLMGAETAPLIADLDKIFATHDVEIIAPNHGCVLQGADVVKRHVAMVRRMLTEIEN